MDLAARPISGSSLLGRDLTLVAKHFRARLEARLAEVGSTLPAWAVLSAALGGECLSQRELADRMGIEAATLTRHLDRLEADGLVARRRDPDDRRILRVVPTTGAIRLHRRLDGVARGLDAELTAGLSGPEIAELRRLLTRLSTNLTETDADDECPSPADQH